MRISDCSSDVCSSDLVIVADRGHVTVGVDALDQATSLVVGAGLARTVGADHSRDQAPLVVLEPGGSPQPVGHRRRVAPIVVLGCGHGPGRLLAPDQLPAIGRATSGDRGCQDGVSAGWAVAY